MKVHVVGCFIEKITLSKMYSVYGPNLDLGYREQMQRHAPQILRIFPRRLLHCIKLLHCFITLFITQI